MRLSAEHVAGVTVENIFSVGHEWGDRSPGDIAELIEELDAESIILSAYSLPALDPAEREPAALEPFSGRSDDHRELCSRAAKWLEAEGLGRPVMLEPRYPFGFNVRADVGSKGGKMLIEVGYTYSAKVLQALPEGLTIGVAPYAEHVGERDEVLFVFTRAKPLKRESRDRFAVDPFGDLL